MIRRRLRYAPGGPLPFNTDYAQAGVMAGSLFDSVTPEDRFGVKSDFSAGLSGGLKRAGEGATLGSAFGPVGTLIGGSIGLVAGAAEGISGNEKRKKEESTANTLADRREAERSKGILSSYQQGNNTNQIYAKYGGAIQKMLNGGNLQSLSSENVEVQGPSHENGGVALSPDVEVEGGETINNNYVFSKELGYATLHKPIARAIGKIEKKPESNATRKTLEILRNKEEALKASQEATKQALGITTGQAKYALGGETPPGRQQRIAEAYNSYLQANEGFKPLAPVEESDPIFSNEKSYNDFYTSKAASRLSPEEQQIYRNHKNQGRPEDAQNLLILRGGTLGYDTYKNFVPREDPTTMATASFGKSLSTRREVARVGFNKGQGRLGFRLR